MSAVRTAVEGEALVVTIDRPEARNAVNLAVAEGIAAAMDRLDEDDALRVGILTGAGGTFCAGMDLKAFVAGERPYVGDRGFAGITQRAARKPLIAAVEGWALAGGLRGRAGLRPDRRRGATPASASPRSSAGWWPPPARCCACRAGSRTTWRWSWRSPASRSAPSGRHSSASSSRLTDARRGAGRRARAGGDSSPATARWRSTPRSRSWPPPRDWPADEAWERQGEIAGPVFTSEDAREGATAFAEKRDPVWRGR